MLKINFCRTGKVIPDFAVEKEVHSVLATVSIGSSQEVSLEYANILVINVYRAYLNNEYAHIQHLVKFYSEGCEIDMNQAMRSEQLWNNPDANVAKRILTRLIQK